MKKQAVALLGAGNMGTAMAEIMAKNGYLVKLWNYEGDLQPLQDIEQCGENKKYLPGIKLSKNIRPCYELSEVVKGVKVIFFVVSSGAIESVMKALLPFLKNGMVLVDVSKGLHPFSNELIPHVMKRMAKGKKVSLVGLTGPAVACQIVDGYPAVMVAASSSFSASKEVQKLFKNTTLKVLLGKDMVGGELVQSFKNVYAIGLGVAQGLGFPFNTQAILFTLALSEMSLVNKKMGGKMDTVYGFAGLGDFLTTALSPEGRNRRFGECLGQGLCSADALSKVQQTVEGITAIKCLMSLSRTLKLKLPFASAIYNVIEGKKDPKKSIDEVLKTIS